MFGTEMMPVTFWILVVQVALLPAQLVIFVSRPEDKQRLRFLWLILAYISYNLFSGLFPDKNIPINLLVQTIIAYGSGSIVAIYFIYYIYLEFHIKPFRLFKVKYLIYILTLSFLLLFVTPYLLTGELVVARKWYLGAPLFIAIAYLIRVSKDLYAVCKKRGEESSKLFKFRLFAGNLGLLNLSFMPMIVAMGDYQTLEQSVVNFGFLLMMIAYILDFVDKAKQETMIINDLKNKEQQSASHEMQIADQIIENVLLQLKEFEDNKDYLKGKITLNILANRFETNSRYLSKIVKIHKEKSFTEYITHLKIEYVKNRLETDEQFRNFTLSAIARELGYKRPEAFQRVFLKKEHITLKAFIKNLRDQK